MSDRSFTLFEPHLHGNIQIGPETVGRGEAAESSSSTAPDVEGPPPAAGIAVALVATVIAILIARKVRGRGDDA